MPSLAEKTKVVGASRICCGFIVSSASRSAPRRRGSDCWSDCLRSDLQRVSKAANLARVAREPNHMTSDLSEFIRNRRDSHHCTTSAEQVDSWSLTLSMVSGLQPAYSCMSSAWQRDRTSWWMMTSTTSSMNEINWWDPDSSLRSLAVHCSRLDSLPMWWNDCRRLLRYERKQFRTPPCTRKWPSRTNRSVWWFRCRTQN